MSTAATLLNTEVTSANIEEMLDCIEEKMVNIAVKRANTLEK